MPSIDNDVVFLTYLPVLAGAGVIHNDQVRSKRLGRISCSRSQTDTPRQRMPSKSENRSDGVSTTAYTTT